MKKIFLLAFTYLAANFSAQFTTGTATDPRFNTNTFLDASENTVNFDNNTNKGLNFPQVDLRTFKLDFSMTDGITYPTYYDGMVVYNKASGTTSGNALTTQSTIAPGFYYFSNPNGATNGNITSGVWLPLGASSKINVTTSETATNTTINGTQVYAIKGTFQTNGTSTTPIAPIATIADDPATAQAPGMYGITIYKAGTNIVYDRSVYSYNPATGVLVTGSPRISVVYPQDTYDYVLEYVK